VVSERLQACLRLSAQAAQACNLLVIHATSQACFHLAQAWPATQQGLHLVRLGGGPSWSRQRLSPHATLTDWGALSALHDGLGQFDAVWLSADAALPLSEHQVLAQGLRRRVWRNAWLVSDDALTAEQASVWAANGWSIAAAGDNADALAQPRWPCAERPWPQEQHAIVIGAGLAGAATVAELTERGWRVDWLDAGKDVAQGASALPVGMLSPHPTAKPTPMSELTQLGMAATVDALQRHLPNQTGWLATHVDDAHGANPRQDTAYLIEPAALVRAWVTAADASGLLRWHPSTAVARIQRSDGQWQALCADQQVQAQAPVLIVASAFGARSLLGTTAQALRPVAGQMSWAALQANDDPPAPHPIRDHGVLSPDFSGSRGRLWAVGSTYRRGVSEPTETDADHDANRNSLQRLCPGAVQRFDGHRDRGELNAFVGVRCATPDRMPLLGAVPCEQANWPARGGLAALARQEGLFAFTALGSRGLTLAAWGATTLADQITSAPLATPAALVQACDPGRKSLRAA
jgi:tRNA 5-methylaminomethyl-2-thiouridine biosynthesis bifunctional protein